MNQAFAASLAMAVMLPGTHSLANAQSAQKPPQTALLSPVEEIYAPPVLCLIFEALSEWHLGKIASCQAAIAQATVCFLAHSSSEISSLLAGYSFGLSQVLAKNFVPVRVSQSAEQRTVNGFTETASFLNAKPVKFFIQVNR